MRVKIRHTIPGHTILDIDKAMKELVIEDLGTYREQTVIKHYGGRDEPDAIREAFMTGAMVRLFIRIQLEDSMHLIEQTEPTKITLHCDRATKANWYRTRTCTYTQVS
ncbi:hypothetical protein ACFWH1_18505 [Streptomyces sp. NPDC127037]|uniref:hypothetical protein n=1 Tax=Streptomyces sp. NPDC127037 TaxID=3347113 RepID=UPI00365DCD94